MVNVADALRVGLDNHRFDTALRHLNEAIVVRDPESIAHHLDMMEQFRNLRVPPLTYQELGTNEKEIEKLRAMANSRA